MALLPVIIVVVVLMGSWGTRILMRVLHFDRSNWPHSVNKYNGEC